MHDILKEIEAERQRQDNQWGGPEHDDAHFTSDWLRFIHQQITKTADDMKAAVSWADQRAAARARLVKIAALALAGIESIDRTAARGAGKE